MKFLFLSHLVKPRVLTEKSLTFTQLLGDFCDDFHTFTGHSFRAAIPSLISSHLDKSTVSELKDWGSWESNSYRDYLKDVRENRKKLFSRIIDCMFSSRM